MLIRYSCESCGYYCNLGLGKTLPNNLGHMLMYVIRYFKDTMNKNTTPVTDP